MSTIDKITYINAIFTVIFAVCLAFITEYYLLIGLILVVAGVIFATTICANEELTRKGR